MKRKSQVHLLSTEDINGVWIARFNKGYNHLYFTSDDEIKEGDWFIKIRGTNNKPSLYREHKQAFMNSEWLNSSDVNDCFKVIATTDTSLLIETEFKYLKDILPQPSPQFIAKYVEEYNKGNIIKEVMVEYEPIGNWRHTEFIHTRDIPKVDKSNQITITRIKDSWNREEHTKALKNAIYQAISYPETFVTGICCDDTKINKWIEENL